MRVQCKKQSLSTHAARWTVSEADGHFAWNDAPGRVIALDEGPGCHRLFDRDSQYKARIVPRFTLKSCCVDGISELEGGRYGRSSASVQVPKGYNRQEGSRGKLLKSMCFTKLMIRHSTRLTLRKKIVSRKQAERIVASQKDTISEATGGNSSFERRYYLGSKRRGPPK